MMLLCYLLGPNPLLQIPKPLLPLPYSLHTPNHRLNLVLSCLSALDVKMLLYVLLCGIPGT